jgi:hypothetical protein
MSCDLQPGAVEFSQAFGIHRRICAVVSRIKYRLRGWILWHMSSESQDETMIRLLSYERSIEVISAFKSNIQYPIFHLLDAQCGAFITC